MEIITRKEAKEQGLKRYFTGEPCKHGHVAERQLSNGMCRACVRGLPEVPEVLAEVARRKAEELEALPAKWGREEAKARGLKWYFTGEPCKRGHIAERQVVNRMCRACARGLPEAPEVMEEVARRQAEELEALRAQYGRPIIMREEAKARGLTNYFTGKPCERGHVCERNTATSQCVDCRKINTDSWMASTENRDKKNAWSKRYRLENPEKMKAFIADWNRRNPEKRRAKIRRWRDKNPEKDRELNRGYRRAERAANPERFRQEARDWRDRNRHKVRAYSMERHTTKLNATPSWLSDAQKQVIIDMYEQAVLCQQLTGVEHHVDHIEPLQGKDRCGLHVPWNLQVLEASENISKGNRPVEHVRWKKM